MRSFVFGLFLSSWMLAADTQELFLGKVDRGELRGKRVSMSGYVNATGCEKLPCRLMAYRWIDGAKVLFILEFQDRFQPYASRKRVLDPIRVHCVAV